jgi:hypothetical protein
MSCNSVKKIVLRITTPMAVLVIVSGNFVFLIVAEFRESLAVCNCGGDKITHLLCQHLRLQWLY